MNNKKKKRCVGCLLLYSENQIKCPHCGYTVDSGFEQPYYNALPLCTVVDYLRIGRAIQINENSITYIGINTIQNKRILIHEFFPHGYVQRETEGIIVPVEPLYADIVEQEKSKFLQHFKQSVSKNGTVYTYCRLRRKNIPKKQFKSVCKNTALRSIIGSRVNQEDSADIRLFEQGALLVLCDGMGGIQGGETASTECVRIMLEIADTVQYCDEGIIPAVLQRQALKADKYISSLQDMEGNRLQCGTTLLCVVARKNRMYFVSAGDSHIYLMDNNAIQLITEEHNYLANLMEKVKNSEMDYEEALCHPKRAALTSYIGIGSNNIQLHLIEAPILLKEENSILLCSDGLYNAIAEDNMLRIIAGNDNSVDTIANTLIQTVEEQNRPNQDNATLILYKYSEKRRK